MCSATRRFTSLGISIAQKTRQGRDTETRGRGDTAMSRAPDTFLLVSPSPLPPIPAPPCHRLAASLLGFQHPRLFHRLSDCCFSEWECARRYFSPVVELIAPMRR